MYLIAEIGFNHEGNLEIAKEMIKQAAEAGANADRALPSSPHYNAIKCGELNKDEHKILKKFSDQCNIEFISTPYSIEAVNLLEEIGVNKYKISSMDLTNFELLEACAKTGKPIILSTGMSTLAEISNSLNFLKKTNCTDITLLHCISNYPAQKDEINLDFMSYLQKIFDIKVGYSDHTIGIDVCKLAAVLGAKVIEKHFTLDNTKEGADHYHSATPTMIKELITDVKKFNLIIGNKDNILLNRADRKNASLYRRGFYSKYNLKKQQRLKREEIYFCRPANKIYIENISTIINKPTTNDIEEYEEINYTNIDTNN